MDRRAPFFAAAGLCTAALIGTRWLVRSSGGSAPPRAADTEDSMVGVLDARYFDTALQQRFALAQRRLQPNGPKQAVFCSTDSEGANADRRNVGSVARAIPDNPMMAVVAITSDRSF